MSTFKERILNEKAELNEKRSKLDAFIGSEAFTKIDPVQKSLLHIQFQSMSTYSECLTQRIEWLDREEKPESFDGMAASNGITSPPHETEHP